MLGFQHRYLFRSTLRFLCLIALTLCLLLMQNAIASSQGVSIFDNQKAGTIPPGNVTRYGGLEVTWVRSPLNGKRLFQIAAPTVLDRNNLRLDDLPVEVRASSVEALLRIETERFRNNTFQRLVHQFQRWDSERIRHRSAEVVISTLNNRPVIQVESSDRSRALTIVTVTQPDVDFYSETPEVLSEEWREILQGEIDQLEDVSSLEWARQGLRRSLEILLGATAITGVCSFLHWWLGRQRRRLQMRNQANAEIDHETLDETFHEAQTQGDTNDNSSDDSPPIIDSSALNASSPQLGLLAQRTRFLKTLQRRPSLKRQLNILKFFQWFLVWVIIFAWYGSLIGLTYTLPMITSWRTTLLSEPFKLLLILFSVNLALRINRTVTRRFKENHQSTLTTLSSEAQRKSLRANTIGDALEGFWAVLIVSTGLLLALSTFGLSTRSVLAWGAVLGLAISFGTQSLIKDVVNGGLILIEDQFAVGDVISVNDMSGFVEELSLRSTRLRSADGQLITIPNGKIAEVCNLTRLWSRVDFTIEVAYENDPDKVLVLLNDIAQKMYDTPEWREKMPSPPEVLGIDHLAHSGILIRVWIKTMPIQQWAVGREFRLRVRRAFETHDIPIGKPQWISHNTLIDPNSVQKGSRTSNPFMKTELWNTQSVGYESDYDIHDEPS